MEYFVIIISSIFVNNIVLSQFLGICPFLGVSGKVSTSLGMGAAVTFVLAIASIAAYLIQYHILVPLHIEYMQTIVFILVIAALVQMVQKEYNLGEAVVYAVAVAVGFTLALVLFAGLRERLELENVPKALQGVPIALITAGILAMAFMGFSGLVR